MNPEIKKRWVEALRSGKYEQGKYYLKKSSSLPGIDSEYCCLGVLTDLYLKEKKLEWISIGYTDVLPEAVCNWAGCDDLDPEIDENNGYTASDCNDDGKSFNEIADLIEKNL